MRATWMGLLGIAAAAAYGCGSCGGGEEPDAGTPKYTADNLCQQLASRQCDFYVRCQADPFTAVSGGSPGADAGLSIDVLYRVPESERARCEASTSSSLDCRALEASLRNGRTELVQASVGSCLDTAWPKDTCVRDAVAAMRVCEPGALVHARVAPGGACSLDLECDGGYCTAASLEACGACAAPSSADGAPCTQDSMCNKATHWCDENAGTCTPYAALNASCDITNLEQCGPGRVCARAGFMGLMPKCIVAHKEGEPCTMNYFECLREANRIPALVCAPTPVQGGGTADKCVKVQSLPGGPCGGGEGAAFGFVTPFCPETQYCLSGTCADRRTRGVPCGASDECAAGLRCQDAGDGGASCEPFSDVGGACASAADCQALLACPAPGSCQPKLALVDEPCTADRACANGGCAGLGTCAPLADAGVGCGAASECASNVCSTTCQTACWE